jgi:hypothetical protein
VGVSIVPTGNKTGATAPAAVSNAMSSFGALRPRPYRALAVRSSIQREKTFFGTLGVIFCMFQLLEGVLPPQMGGKK